MRSFDGIEVYHFTALHKFQFACNINCLEFLSIGLVRRHRENPSFLQLNLLE